MSLSAKIREQIINSFRAELAEHVQTMNQGLLALEQKSVSGAQRDEQLAEVFRAAHSLKGAARAVGVNAIEQLAHALEDVLGGLQHNHLTESQALYTACFQAVDAIQTVQAAYEAGETTPPPQSLQALAGLGEFQRAATTHAKPENAISEVAADQPVEAPPLIAPPRPERKTASPKSAKKALQESMETVSEMFQENQPDEKNTSPAVESAPEQPQPTRVPPADEGTFKSASNTVTNVAATSASAGVATTSASTSVATPVAVDETIRVNVSKLDALMAQLSELLITKIHAEQRLAQVRQAQEYVTSWQKDWLSVRSSYGHMARRRSANGGNDGGGFDSVEQRELGRLLDYLRTSQDRLRELNALINDLSRQYSSDTMQMSLVIDGLEEEIKRVRMLPLFTITGTFGRMLRDLAQASNKDVRYEVIGGDVELDKRVLEQIKDPLIHLLRNAVDHGLESSEKRLAAGKTAYGTVTLEARQVGKDVAISVSDDGAGINIPAIRHLAVRRNIPNAAMMTDAELTDLIFAAGFSTSPMITDISGRGVGLDVVRRNVETLGGRINIEWQEGAGSRFTLVLPLALTSSRALLVHASGQKFAIPLNAIERIEYVRPENVISVGGHETLQYNDRPLVLVHLGDVLGMPPTHQRTADQRLPVIILAAAERRMAFAVDELDDELEVVMKGLGKQLARVGGIAGASVMGSGDVLLILNVADLIKLAQRGVNRSVLEKAAPVAVPVDERPRRRILVVDDSITTRTLEKNILEAAGFQVRIAMDGLEALNTVATGELPDLIISDVSMPRMDGLGLAARIKGDPRTAAIPFILVTSLDSPEDKARGVEVGADAYIVKSSFDQQNLLETIEQLI
jgi:two-component system chemotaxis sensor kinase CheA